MYSEQYISMPFYCTKLLVLFFYLKDKRIARYRARGTDLVVREGLQLFTLGTSLFCSFHHFNEGLVGNWLLKLRIRPEERFDAR